VFELPFPYGARSRDTVEGTEELREVGPTGRSGGWKVVRNSVREHLPGRMNLCLTMGGTVAAGKPRTTLGSAGTAPDVEKGATEAAYKVP